MQLQDAIQDFFVKAMSVVNPNTEFKLTTVKKEQGDLDSLKEQVCALIAEFQVRA